MMRQKRLQELWYEEEVEEAGRNQQGAKGCGVRDYVTVTQGDT